MCDFMQNVYTYKHSNPELSFELSPHSINKNIPVTIEQNLKNRVDILLAEKTAQYLNAQLDNKINLGDIERKMSTNRNRLSRAFKARYGMTVFKWLREQRIMYAMELLETTSLTITQIADKVGYPDSNNFSTAFRHRVHMSPTEYRKKLYLI